MRDPLNLFKVLIFWSAVARLFENKSQIFFGVKQQELLIKLLVEEVERFRGLFFVHSRRF